MGDPQLAAVQDVIAPFQRSAGLQGEGVGTRTGFAERIRAASVRRHAWQKSLLLFLCPPAQQGVVDQRVLHVYYHAGRSVDARYFFHRKDRLEELAPTAAVLFRNLNPHQAELEKLVD